MRIKNTLDKNKVIFLKISESDVDGFLLNTDFQNDGTLAYVDELFVQKLVRNYLPEYAFASHEDLSGKTHADIVQEAAISVLKIAEIKKLKYYFANNIDEDKWEKEVLDLYLKKGIFGELILHFLLREFKSTIPLISKVYLKDSFAHEAHGFDAVHVTPSDSLIWLGECKFYSDGKGGIRELIDDLNKHLNSDYLNEQFIHIDRALKTSLFPDRDIWINKLKNTMGTGLLKDVFNGVCVPLLCIYDSKIPSKFFALPENDFDIEYIKHIEDLKLYFDDNNTFPNKHNTATVLMLFPLESKRKIVKLILEKIYHMQNI